MADQDRSDLRGRFGQTSIFDLIWEEDGLEFPVRVIMDCGRPHVDLSSPLFTYLVSNQSPLIFSTIPLIIAHVEQVELEVLKEQEAAEELRARLEAEYAPRKPAAGFVYLIESAAGLYKIGRTANVQARLKLIATSSPHPVNVKHSFKTKDSIKAEALLHAKFANYRRHGEWFDLQPSDVEWFCLLQDGSFDE
jgi:hypothetical protein